jgi:response regulator RpfG family c-di-GMP phosphodiesterase
MNEELFLSIIKTQKIEYVLFDSSFNLIQTSPGLSSILSPDRIIKDGVFITDIFIELLGYEQYLIEVRDGQASPLRLDWINQTSLLAASENIDDSLMVKYINLQVYPFQSGLLVILRDISNESRIEQLVYNRRNELDILTKKLIDDLEYANAELNQAYQTTLEGWARALEMRDVETKGHSVRVVNLTRELASAMGIGKNEIPFYCYGALLHDIGKMGIPDRILLKPGALNDAEWLVMKKHPIIAETLLSPIKYLDKALCIPVYHHEKWNGKGYPYALKGDEIPLPARIFTVVDVYDALISDRPYRLAWKQKDILQYILERKGVDFDPQVVECFLSLFKNIV